MKPEKRLNIRQLPAVTKRFCKFDRESRAAGVVPLTEKAEKDFSKQVVLSFFPKKDVWVGRIFLRLADKEKTMQESLEVLRRRLITHGSARDRNAADKIIVTKFSFFLKRAFAVRGSWFAQRAALAVSEYGHSFHSAEPNIIALRMYFQNILDLIKKGG